MKPEQIGFHAVEEGLMGVFAGMAVQALLQASGIPTISTIPVTYVFPLVAGLFVLHGAMVGAQEE